MRKPKPTKLLFFIATLIGLLASALIYNLYQKEASDRVTREGKYKLQLIDASKKVWALWRKGVNSELYSEVKKECPKEKFGNFYSCNQELLKCVLDNSLMKPSLKGVGKIRFSDIQKISRRENGTIAPREGVKLSLKLESSHLTIFLENSCEKLLLPKRIYGFGTERNPPMSERFDNFKSLIFIDKRLTPSRGKTLKDMQASCSARGMQLLESHVLDAASFHPVDLKNNRPQEFLKPLLPWTRKLKSEFLYKAERDKSFKFSPDFCDFIYSKECKSKKNSSLPSWMGLMNPLGGFVEVVRNVLHPDQVLVPSSTYFSIHSPWHRLGLRAIWNGESFDKRDFIFGDKGIPPLEQFKDLQTGFRCMQEVWQ